MKVLFLDIDGVVNCKFTKQRRHDGFIGIDPVKAREIRRIIKATGCEVVLSSTWRRKVEDRAAVRKEVCQFIDTTPEIWSGRRGEEIQRWLDAHEVDDYAIVDDDPDMLPDQAPHLFATTWNTGITPEITDAIITHLNRKP